MLSVVEYPVEHLVGELGAKWFADWENNKHLLLSAGSRQRTT